jgi:Na+-driven multidrug efflux pump
VAAQNISSTISNLFNVVYIQLGGCIAIIVGQHLGAGNLEEAKDSQRKMTFFSVVCCAGVAFIMMLVGGFFPELYETEESIKLLAKEFIMISAAVMPICAYCHCSYFTLRSGGKTVITFLFDSVYTWVIVIPVATILAKYSTLGIVLVFFLVSFLEIIKAIIGFFMVKRGVWIQNIVKESN